ADADNPKGYYEFERVKQLEQDTSWLPEAEGKVVKIISQLLQHLPADRRYKVVFMRREMDEILASQRRMLKRRGEATDTVDDDKLERLFRQHVRGIQHWLNEQPNFDVTYLSYNRILENPYDGAQRLDAFLEQDLDVAAMVEVVDPALYRQRA
ncbi:MAG: sulfotransferase family protein, partial [Chloroflexota bacterium]